MLKMTSENKIKTPNSNYNEKKVSKNKVNIRYTKEELKQLAKSNNTTESNTLKDLVKVLRDRTIAFVAVLFFFFGVAATAFALFNLEPILEYIEYINNIIFNKSHEKDISNKILDEFSYNPSDGNNNHYYPSSQADSESQTEKIDDNKKKPNFRERDDSKIRPFWWDPNLKIKTDLNIFPPENQPGSPELRQEAINPSMSPSSPTTTIDVSPQSTPGSPDPVSSAPNQQVSLSSELEQAQTQITGAEPQPLNLDELDPDAMMNALLAERNNE